MQKFRLMKSPKTLPTKIKEAKLNPLACPVLRFADAAVHLSRATCAFSTPTKTLVTSRAGDSSTALSPLCCIIPAESAVRVAIHISLQRRLTRPLPKTLLLAGCSNSSMYCVQRCVHAVNVCCMAMVGIFEALFDRCCLTLLLLADVLERVMDDSIHRLG